MRAKRLQLPLLNVTDADTLLYISPNTSPNPPHRVSSKALLASGSTVFTDLLGPTSQHRVARRRGLVGRFPRGIKLALDLSPPNEGPEALDVVLKLYCPKEVTQWKTEVRGPYIEEDDDYSPQSPTSKRGNRPPSEGGSVTRGPPGAPTGQGQDQNNDSPSTDISSPDNPTEDTKTEPAEWWLRGCNPPPAHSTTRHSAAIERVLHILHGLDPQIRTATMWYTVCKVAVLLNCESSVVDHVIAWLYTNKEFIAQHPEIVLDIAGNFRCEILFKDAFAVIVGRLLREHHPSGDAGAEVDPYRIHEAALPWRKNIIHAHRSLRARIESIHTYLSFIPNWLDDVKCVPEYAKLTNVLALPNLSDEILDASTALDSSIRAGIFSLFKSSFGPQAQSPHPALPNQEIFGRAHWQGLEALSFNYHHGPADWELIVRTRDWHSTLEMFLQKRRDGVGGEAREQGRDKERGAGSSRKPLKVLEIRGMGGQGDGSDGQMCLVKPLEITKSTTAATPDCQDARSRPDRHIPHLDASAVDFCFLELQQDQPPPPYKPSATSSSGDILPRRIVPRGMSIEITNPINKRKSPFEPQEEKLESEDLPSYESPSTPTSNTDSSSKRRCSPERAAISSLSVCPYSGTADSDDFGEHEIFKISGIHGGAGSQSPPSGCAKGKGKEVRRNDMEESQDDGEFRPSNIPLVTNPFATFTLPLGARNTSGQGDRASAFDIGAWLGSESALFDSFFMPGSEIPDDSTPSSAASHTNHTLPLTLDNFDGPVGPGGIGGHEEMSSALPVHGLDPNTAAHGISEAQDLVSAGIREADLWLLDQVISPDTIWTQSLRHVAEISRQIMTVPTIYDPTIASIPNLIVCLTDEEWKFLPLWAGGLDDGSGGVFGELERELEIADGDDGDEVESLPDSYVESLVGAESVESFEARVYSEDEFGSVEDDDDLETLVTDGDDEDYYYKGESESEGSDDRWVRDGEDSDTDFGWH